jgi:hypothetical protein
VGVINVHLRQKVDELLSLFAIWLHRTCPSNSWDHGDVMFGAPDVDVIFDPSLQDDLCFAVISQPLGAMSRPDWVQAHLPPSWGICQRAYGAGGRGSGRRVPMPGSGAATPHSAAIPSRSSRRPHAATYLPPRR